MFRFESENLTNWPPMLGYMDDGIVWRIPPENMNDTYLTNPRGYYCPTYFYDGTDPYPKTYMHGAGYFLPWWSLPCIYQQNFQVDGFYVLGFLNTSTSILSYITNLIKSLFLFCIIERERARE